MNRPRIIARLTATFILLISALCGHASISGSWQLHPAFFRNVEQIADGEAFTYFLLHQQTFGAGYADHAHNTATLYRYDKQANDEKIEAMHSIYPAFPATVRLTHYSPSGRFLMAIAEEGDVWVIPDSGSPFSIGSIAHTAARGVPQAISMTEDADGIIWIATTFGYAAADPARHDLRIVAADFQPTHLCRMGTDIIFFTKESAYIAQASPLPSRLDQLSTLGVTADGDLPHLIALGALTNPTDIMPLSHSTFAFLGPHPSKAHLRTIALATRTSGSWTVMSLYELELRMIAEAYTLTTRTAANPTTNKEGYYVTAQNTAVQISKGIDPDLSSADPRGKFISDATKSFSKGTDTWRESASWDGINFWFFDNPRGFYRRSRSDSGWSDPSPFMLPEGPSAFMADHLTWHPDHGLIVSSHGTSQLLDSNIPATPWLIDIFRHGSWSHISPVIHADPAFTASEETAAIFKKAADAFPLSLPAGLAIDPADTDHAFAGSVFQGWARINLANPSEIPLHVAHSKSNNSGLPGFIDAYPLQNSWSSICSFSAPGFDADGNLWMLHLNLDQAKADAYSVDVCLYTAADLRAMSNANTDPSGFRTPHLLRLKTESQPSKAEYLIPLTAEKNRNLVAFVTGAYDSAIYILDHNGTPDDPSDDRLAAVRDLRDESTGSHIPLFSPYLLWEDPITGDLWASYSSGAFRLDPAAAFDNPCSATRHRVKSTPDGETDRKILEAVPATAFATDSEGRLWIGTLNAGVICLSPDRSTIIGELNMANSPLPSDRILSICHDPERRSMMISTTLGLAEFFPSFAGGASDRRQVRVVPANIAPDWRGWVSIEGADAAQTLTIADHTGKTVCTLKASESGTAQWNGLTASGSRLSAGTYTVSDSSGRTVATFRAL